MVTICFLKPWEVMTHSPVGKLAVTYRPSNRCLGPFTLVVMQALGKISLCNPCLGTAHLMTWELGVGRGGHARVPQRRSPGLGLTPATSPKHQEVQKEPVSVCSGSSCQDASLV